VLLAQLFNVTVSLFALWIPASSEVDQSETRLLLVHMLVEVVEVTEVTHREKSSRELLEATSRPEQS
jgi:hypothetical protein